MNKPKKSAYKVEFWDCGLGPVKQHRHKTKKSAQACINGKKNRDRSISSSPDGAGFGLSLIDKERRYFDILVLVACGETKKSLRSNYSSSEIERATGSFFRRKTILSGKSVLFDDYRSMRGSGDLRMLLEVDGFLGGYSELDDLPIKIGNALKFSDITTRQQLAEKIRCVDNGSCRRIPGIGVAGLNYLREYLAIAT